MEFSLIMSTYNLKSLFIVDKHLLMKRMSEEKALSYLLRVDESLIDEIMKRRGNSYDIILDDIVPDEDIKMIMRNKHNINPYNFFNYKHFHLTNERIKTLIDDKDISLDQSLIQDLNDNKLICEYNTNLENDRIGMLQEIKLALENKLVHVDNFLLAIDDSI